MEAAVAARKVSTCLWFEAGGREAAEFYVSLIAGSRMLTAGKFPEGSDKGAPGSDMVVEFELAGTPYQILNGGPHFKLDEAASIVVRTVDQAETDRLWFALTENGGRESQCGWLVDKFGVSWQIVPERAIELLTGPHAPKAFAAIMPMKKIDIAALEAAVAAE